MHVWGGVSFFKNLDRSRDLEREEEEDEEDDEEDEEDLLRLFFVFFLCFPSRLPPPRFLKCYIASRKRLGGCEKNRILVSLVCNTNIHT